MIEALLFVAVGLAGIAGLAVVRLGALLDRSAENRAALDEIARTLLGLDRRLQTFSEQVAEASRVRGEELAGTLESFHRLLVEALRQMAELHERAVRGDPVPVRHARAIREEIRRARDQREGQVLREPSGAQEAPAAAAQMPAEAQGTDPRTRGLAALLSRVRRRTSQRRGGLARPKRVLEDVVGDRVAERDPL